MDKTIAARRPSLPRAPYKIADDETKFPPPRYPPHDWNAPITNPDGSCLMCCLILSEMIDERACTWKDAKPIICCYCGTSLQAFDSIFHKFPEIWHERLEDLAYRRRRGDKTHEENLKDPEYHKHMVQAAIRRGQKKRERRELVKRENDLPRNMDKQELHSTGESVVQTTVDRTDNNGR